MPSKVTHALWVLYAAVGLGASLFRGEWGEASLWFQVGLLWAGSFFLRRWSFQDGARAGYAKGATDTAQKCKETANELAHKAVEAALARAAEEIHVRTRSSLN